MSGVGKAPRLLVIIIFPFFYAQCALSASYTHAKSILIEAEGSKGPSVVSSEEIQPVGRNAHHTVMRKSMVGKEMVAIWWIWIWFVFLRLSLVVWIQTVASDKSCCQRRNYLSLTTMFLFLDQSVQKVNKSEVKQKEVHWWVNMRIKPKTRKRRIVG